MAIAIALGLMTEETNFQTDAKYVFWSNSPIGNMLNDFLVRLGDLGIVEHQETAADDEYRWNPSFIGSWEEQTPADYVFPPLKPRTFKESIFSWTEDHDTVQFALAESFGLMKPDNDFGSTKHVFYSDHPIGHMLNDFLMRLVEIGILEYQLADTGEQWRWNPVFKGRWENGMVKIKYREFWDVPRLFIFHLDCDIALFDCRFDESIDEYPECYKVYGISREVQVSEKWNRISEEGQFWGEVKVADVKFDETKRREMDLECFKSFKWASNS